MLMAKWQTKMALDVRAFWQQNENNEISNEGVKNVSGRAF